MARRAMTVAAGVCVLALAGWAAGVRRGETLPYVQWIGADSKRTEPGFEIVRDDAAWRALWGAHTGTDTTPGGAMRRHAAPEVNFDRCVVVAHFRGRSTNHDGEVVHGVDESAERVRVRFIADTFQTASFDGPDRGVATTPYGIWVLPRTEKPVVIEEGTRELKNEPVRWREVKRFDGR